MARDRSRPDRFRTGELCCYRLKLYQFCAVHIRKNENFDLRYRDYHNLPCSFGFMYRYRVHDYDTICRLKVAKTEIFKTRDVLHLYYVYRTNIIRQIYINFISCWLLSDRYISGYTRLQVMGKPW